MNAQHFVIDDGAKRQVVENFCAITPDVHTSVLLEALVIESINLSDLSRFVVSSDQCDSFGIANLSIWDQTKIGTVPSVLGGARMFRRSCVLCRRNRPWRGSWCRGTRRPLRRAPSSLRTVREYRRRSRHIKTTWVSNRNTTTLQQLTVTGDSTTCTLLSSSRISLALVQRAFTSASLICSHLLS